MAVSVHCSPLQPNPLLSQSNPQNLQPSDFVNLAVNAGFAVPLKHGVNSIVGC
jgi:hypothetical protein